MIKYLPLLIVLLALPYLCSFSQEQPDSDRLRRIVKARGEAEVMIKNPGAAAIDLLTRHVSIRSLKDNKVYIILTPLTVEWFINSAYDYSIADYPAGKYVLSSRSMKEAMDWQSYPTLTQYDSIMHFYEENYPFLCRLDTIGTSTKGRIIYAIKISSDAGVDKDLPGVFYSSTMHGDEIGGFVLMLRLCEFLLDNYETDDRVRNLLDNLEIWINPLANPDGTFNAGDTIISPLRGNANGMDLNRNFPDPVYPVTDLQKETIDMIRFMRKHRFVLSANFHSGSEVVNYPWDRWERYHADDAWFYLISRQYADTVHKYSPQNYMDDLDNGVTNGFRWYPVNGGRQDFVTYELHGHEVTIELDNDRITPASDLAYLWDYNRKSLLGYLENALYGIHGIVKDAATGNPVPVAIYINGHDRDNSHIFSDTLSGRFIRLIDQGFWNLVFSANGYHNRVEKNIPVTSGVRTDIVVLMNSIKNPVDTTNPVIPLLYPNPCTNYINAVLPQCIKGSINIRIFSQSGIKLADYNAETYDGIPLVIDVTNLHVGSYVVTFLNRISGIKMKGVFIKTGS